MNFVLIYLPVKSKQSKSYIMNSKLISVISALLLLCPILKASKNHMEKCYRVISKSVDSLLTNGNWQKSANWNDHEIYKTKRLKEFYDKIHYNENSYECKESMNIEATRFYWQSEFKGHNQRYNLSSGFHLHRDHTCDILNGRNVLLVVSYL